MLSLKLSIAAPTCKPYGRETAQENSRNQSENHLLSIFSGFQAYDPALLWPMSEENKPGNLADPAVILATWFGAGHLPKAPGTWGSLAALPFAWVLQAADGWPGLAIGIVICFGVGIWASNGYIDAIGGEDPAPVVIDEVAGQWLTLLPAAYLMPGGPDWRVYIIGFVLFRLFDVIKPWPISWADRTIKGGLGIMLDDILAAIFGAVILGGIIHWGVL